ncbi:capsular exopolysaccharide family [Aquiflexum balticum DSM 16537]|uniref:non-specific protein-tyrosine kinase n=1 Tax=Aquiflexum balticum DSM 16537 TaxID=758820 RepID=A0A1W2H539_9BACT|nr:polysaccharide biosynthesis tyrosine autokinase [Aquiflexum balticum]SMD44060.1 capsular exopolysaccharide family [Aquiflexum balticum DSM 16537]
MQKNNPYPFIPDPFLPHDEEDVELKVVLFNYLKFWPFILASILVCLMSAFLFNRYATPIYKVQSTVIVEDESQALGTDLFQAAGLLPIKSNVENEIGILKSYALSAEAIEVLGLDVFYFEDEFFTLNRIYSNPPVLINVDWSHKQPVAGKFNIEVFDENHFNIEMDDSEFDIFNPKDPFYKEKTKNLPEFKATYTFGETIENEFIKITVENNTAKKGDRILFELFDTPSLALLLREKVDVSPINKQSSVLNISFETPVRKMGEDYINMLMEVYLQRELKEKNKAAENTIRFIEDQLSGITDSLTFFEGRLERYRSENRTFNLSQEGSQIFARLQELEKDKSVAEINLKYFQSLQNYIINDDTDGLMIPSVSDSTDPVLQALVVTLNDLQAEKLRLSYNFSEQAPVIREINNQIKNTKRALQENVTSFLNNTNTYLQEVNTQIRKVEREINVLPETERRLLGIQRKFSVNENIYLYLLQKRAESEILKASNMPKNAILDNAMAGQKPVFPRKIINLIIGMSIGLFFSIGYIAVRDFLNTKIEDPKELERMIKTPLIGMIGRNKDNDPRPVLNNPRSSVTESFRNIRADMSYLSPNKEHLTILFTSSISGEGKTFASINMASVYSLLGKKTLLIGLDLRKPKIAEDFSLTNDIGMSTCLSKGIAWQDVVKHTQYDNLDVILSGPVPPNPAELLLQAKFSKIMSEIKEAYEVIILDCPPAGLVSETKELFKFADVNFYIFRQAFSHKNNIQVLNNLIEKGGIEKVYAILNDVHIDRGYGFGYGYGYGYGYSGQHGYHDEIQAPWWKRALWRR